MVPIPSFMLINKINNINAKITHVHANAIVMLTVPKNSYSFILLARRWSFALNEPKDYVLIAPKNSTDK